jgi:hypothetical protein
MRRRFSRSSTESSCWLPFRAWCRVDCFDSFMEQQQLRIRNGMVTFLEVLRCSSDEFCCYFFLWDGGQLLAALIDTVFCVVAPFADLIWFSSTKPVRCSQRPTLQIPLIGYMTARFWSTTVKPRHRSWKKATHNDGCLIARATELVWICRSTALASELLPIMNETWSALVDCWGEENARNACRLQIYIT